MLTVRLSVADYQLRFNTTLYETCFNQWPLWRPVSIFFNRLGLADERHYEIERLSRHHFAVHGVKIERLAAMTDFSNEEAADRFQRVLDSSGISAKLVAAGVQDGDVVHLGDYELVWGEQEDAADRRREGGRHRRRE